MTCVKNGFMVDWIRELLLLVIHWFCVFFRYYEEYLGLYVY